MQNLWESSRRAVAQQTVISLERPGWRSNKRLIPNIESPFGLRSGLPSVMDSGGLNEWLICPQADTHVP